MAIFLDDDNLITTLNQPNLSVSDSSEEEEIDLLEVAHANVEKETRTRMGMITSSIVLRA